VEYGGNDQRATGEISENSANIYQLRPNPHSISQNAAQGMRFHNGKYVLSSAGK
jgi:hypothetical protein